jgi:hypothetical protein
MEIWGRCGTCARWFYCSLIDAEVWTCPVCAAEPVAIENRATSRRVIAGRRGDVGPRHEVVLDEVAVGDPSLAEAAS